MVPIECVAGIRVTDPVRRFGRSARVHDVEARSVDGQWIRLLTNVVDRRVAESVKWTIDECLALSPGR